LLGDLTVEYCNQLQRGGVIAKASRGRYPTAAVRDYVLAMRQRTLGATEFNTARTELTRERAAAARTARLQREGELLPRDLVGLIIMATFRAVRDQCLGLGAKVAAQCHVAQSVPAVQQIIDANIRESLERLSEMSEAEVLTRIEEAARQQQRGPGRAAASV